MCPMLKFVLAARCDRYNAARSERLKNGYSVTFQIYKRRGKSFNIYVILFYFMSDVGTRKEPIPLW